MYFIFLVKKFTVGIFFILITSKRDLRRKKKEDGASVSSIAFFYFKVLCLIGLCKKKAACDGEEGRLP